MNSEVRAFFKARARKRASLTDRYVTMFALVMGAAVVGRPVSGVFGDLVRQADPARVGPGLAVLLLGLAGFAALARLAGPVALSGPDAAWLLLSPLNRRGVLGRTARVLLTVAVVAGLALGVGLLAVLGAPDQVVWRVLGALVLGVSATVGAMALAVLAQASSIWNSWLSVAIAALVLAAALAAFGLWRHLPGGPLVPALAAIELVRRARGTLVRIPAADLLRSSTRLGHAASAAVTMDPGALSWIAEDNHWRSRTFASRPWPAMLRGKAAAVAWADWRRLGRRPGRLAAMFATAALPALLAAAGGSPVVLGLSVLAGALAVAVTGTAGARRDADNPTMARMLGTATRRALAARAALPALLAATWATLALAGLTLTSTGVTAGAGAGVSAGAGAAALSGVAHGGGAGWWLVGLLVAPAIAAGALRMARRGPVDHSMPVIDTPGGAIPTGPLTWAMTGPDLALLGSIPALVALATAPSPAVLAAQAILGIAVLGGYLARAK